jgi:aminopeptidase
MTTHERKIAAAIDEARLDKLAEVAVKVGLNLQEGQDLFLTAPVTALPFVPTSR